MESGAIVYLYGMQAFALAIVVHYTSSWITRWLYLKLIAVPMLGVIIDMSYTLGPTNLALLFIRVKFWVT
jgi:hypothetical protein